MTSTVWYDSVDRGAGAPVVARGLVVGARDVEVSRRMAAVVSCGADSVAPCRGGLVKALPVRCPRPERDDRELPLAARERSGSLVRGVSGVFARPAQLAVAVVALLISTLAVLVVGSGLGGAPAATGPSTYVVQPGDTVFNVANALAGPGDAGELADWLIETRAGAPLRVGERISRS